MIIWLQKQLKSTIKFLLHNIFWAVLTGVITVPIFLSWVIGKLNTLFILIQEPTPLWLVIASIFLVVIYIHFNTSKETEPDYNIFLMEDSGFKWKITDKNNGRFSISPIPYCKYHDSKYIETSAGQYMCRELIGSKCESKILDIDEVNLLKNMAKSKAEKLINNFKTKC